MSNNIIEVKKPKEDLNYTSSKKPVHTPEGAEKPLPKVTIDGKTYRPVQKGT